MISDHEGKATLLWIAYRNKMRVSLNPEMRFDLERLIQVNFDFSILILPISNEEVDRIVKLMPSDKAPGPDGFNGCFHKKCWPIIKQTFYDLCTKFYNDNLNLERINSSFITLVPKINNPETVNDFRPISLLNCSIKLLITILAKNCKL